MMRTRQNHPRILTIGTDASIFEPGSATRSRLQDYGRLFREFHVLCLTPPGFRPGNLGGGVFLYPTNARFSLWQPVAAFRVGRAIIKKNKIDWLSAQDPFESGLAACLLARWFALPLQLQIHSDVLSPAFRASSWKNYIRFYLARFIIPRADRLRVVSVRIQRSLVSYFRIPESKITLLPIFVDREAIVRAEPVFNLHERYPDLDFIVLMVSRLEPEKNIGLALRAFRELAAEFPRMGLVIVGDGSKRGMLERESKRGGIAKQVLFEGWQRDLASYYKTADLYLMTSDFEGYGRSVIEAASVGLPILMTDVGVARDIIRDHEGGRIVGVGDRQGLIAVLRDAQQNYPAMKSMAERFRARVLAISPRTYQEYLEQYLTSFL